jgi:phosphate transport system permease protein
MDPSPSFTGIARRRKTDWKVLAADRAARSAITLGGLGTIFAVGLVCVFLVWVVIPLFLPSHVARAGAAELAGAPQSRPVLARIDDYQVLGWTLLEDGSVDLFRADSGKLLQRAEPPGGERPSAMAYLPGEGLVVLGYADGKARFGRLGYAVSFLDPTPDLPPAVRDLKEGSVAEHAGGLVERTPEGQLRLQTLRYDAEEPFDLGGGQRIDRIDLTTRGESPVIAAWTADGTLRMREFLKKKNYITGKETVIPSGGDFRATQAAGKGSPRWIQISGVGTGACAVWEDGTLLRFDARTVDAPAFAERIDLLGGRGGKVTAVGALIGKTTMVVGDDSGTVAAWFPIRAPGAAAPDGTVMTRAHVFPGTGAAVTALAPSERTRLLAAGYADGSVRLFHATSEQLIGEGKDAGGAVDAVALTPKEDGLVAVAGARLSRWKVDAPHPEITLHAIFAKVWYESAEHPEHVWQSSSGTDEFEPKFGLIPLIFGTLKATLYSMLFAVPIALLAAIYTSEFLHPDVRSRVKPTIELMASLPSVVLGFLAGIVFAPFLEDLVPASLASFATVPFSILVFAYLGQLLPRRTARSLDRWRLPVCAVLAVPLGIALAFVAGPVVERLLFEGDVKAWLDGQVGTGTGGWMLILLPASAVAVIVLNARWVNPRVLTAASRWTRAQEGRFELVRFAISGAAAVGLALAVSWGLSALGADPRGSYVDTYVQRNSLVVGLVMGFAVIPIIYTLSEDALSSVPEHLRAASLAVGATRWQTAISVILPTAASGLFSACMIGLGRAVGETMIVLMAAGNTPVLEWNIFNGFRTLSANIAVELPEAVQDGTVYRMLFLAALTLFAMTFVLNTVAEYIRQQFRKRAFEL